MQALIIASVPDRSMKTLGNKGLIKIDQKNRIIDYQISQLKKIDANIQIIIACAFDAVKTRKYIEHRKYNNVTIVTHEFDEFINVGRSIKECLGTIEKNNYPLIIMNSGCVFKHKTLLNVTKNTENCYALISKKEEFESKLGCTIDEGKIKFIFYGLGNKICEIFTLSKQGVDNLRKIHIKDSMYLFEVMNALIGNGTTILPKITTNPCLIIDTTAKVKSFNIGLYR